LRACRGGRWRIGGVSRREVGLNGHGEPGQLVDSADERVDGTASTGYRIDADGEHGLPH
jgi:hypothetical protein